MRWLRDFGAVRAVVLIAFFLIALLAWTMDVRYTKESAWLLCDCLWGHYLAYAVMTIGPDLGYIVIGYLVLDFRLKEENKRRALVTQAGSAHKDVTDLSIKELARRGWLYNGTIDRIDMSESHLSGKDLSDASLAGVNLHAANMEKTDLRRARLAGANLTDAQLQGANLGQANLSQAVFGDANLREANLHGANLSGATLRGVNLEGARGATPDQLSAAQTLAGAIMPDGTRLRDEEKGIEGPTFEEWRARHEDGG